MIQTIVIVVVVVIAAILIFASTRPDTFRIQREIDIQAPPEKVFAVINDFHLWADWSPWEKLDPALKRTFSGTASGKGSAYEWEGNKKVGQGRMEILESAPSSRVIIKLDFLKPFEAHNTAEFILTQQGGSTHVSWAMFGPQPFMSKVMCLFFSMDNLVGKDFEKGLTAMKALAEKS